MLKFFFFNKQQFIQKRKFSNRLNLHDFLIQNVTISKINTKWGDMDAFNHINTTIYLRYYEEARMQFFNKIDNKVNELDPEKKCISSHGFTYGLNNVGPILSHSECFYKFPVIYPDKLVIGTRADINNMTKNSIVIHHTIWSRKHQRKVTEGSGKIVAFNYNLNKVTEFPKIWIDSLKILHNETNSNLKYKCNFEKKLINI